MPKIFDVYRFYALTELGEIWYPGFDQRNMTTVENQAAALYRFVGPGVIDGWDVETLNSEVRGESVSADDLAERNSLIDAEPGTFLAFNYEYIGQPAIDDELAWGQVVRVTPGTGVVGVFPAETTLTCYFRLRESDFVYYAWAEAGLCLADGGKAQINIPSDGDADHDEVATATYLATIETTQYDLDPSEGYIYRVVYESERKQLKNLEGALDDALRRAFYRHVHLGGTGHPSKIQLSTHLLLTGTGPVGTTILTLTLDNRVYTWDPADYGIPVVRLNDGVLPDSDYVIQPANGRILLKNSLEDGDDLKVLLPLSFQVRLTMHPDSLITDSLQSNDPNRQRIIYLTDGTTTTDSNGNTIYTIYRWDDGLFKPATVTLDGDAVSEALYTMYPDDGGINFDPALDDDGLTGDSLVVILTHIGDEIEGLLSGTRLRDIDASTFTRGLVDPTRLYGLSHIGQTRHKELASLRPSKRLFSSGDKRRFYAEVTDSDVQHNYACHDFFQSVNLIDNNVMLGTDRGLMLSSTGADNSLSANFVPDRNRPWSFCDDVLQAAPGTNRFKTVYMFAKGGDGQGASVYLSKDEGSSWTELRLPVGDSGEVEPTCFYATTQRSETQNSNFIKTYEYSTLLYLGSRDGLWTATVPEGAGDDEWSWNLEEYARGEVFALQEICTLFKQTSSGPGGTTTLEDFDRSLYVGADDGFYVNGSKVSGLEVKGFYWVRTGGPANQLFWFTDDDVYFTHTGSFTSSEDDESTTERWVHPLSHTGSVELTAARLATTSPVDLDGLDTIDGVTVSSGDRILVKNQDDPSENGLWLADSGAWVRDSDTLLTDCWVQVSQGDTLAGSAWLLTVESGDYNWTNLWWRVATETAALWSQIKQRPSTDDFYALNTSGDERLLLVSILYGDDDGALTPSTESLTWDAGEQGGPRSAYPTTSERVIVGTDRGLFLSTDGGETWMRSNVQFTEFDTLTVYDSDSQRVNDGEFTTELTSQSIVFDSDTPPYANYTYEREYINYYVRPWLEDGAEVIVYVNDEITDITYALFPEDGLIRFTSSLSPEDEVRVTIVRLGAFLSDVGETPHAELTDSVVVGTERVTTLAGDLVASAPEGTELVLSDRTQIPTDAATLELRMSNRSERVGVYVNPSTRRVYLSRPRQGGFDFLSELTDVYIVSIESVLGIEDYISIANSNQTYHLNSVIGANIARLALEADIREPGVYDNFFRDASPGYSADRGLKGALLFNSITDEFDPRASSSTVFAGLEPSSSDSAFFPTTVYCVHNLSADGDGMRVGTDQGVWVYGNDKWSKESSLGAAGRVYFIEEREGLLIAGADTGLWQRAGGEWSLNATYPQSVFDRDTGPWFGTTFEAFGKNDGLAFVWQQEDGFLSDSLPETRDKRVYGLWHSKFIRLKDNGSGETTQELVDAIYLCTEDGLYGATNGPVSGQYSQFLIGREMFGDNKLTIDGIALPSGGTTSVPVKIYAIFQAPAKPTCDGSTPKQPIPILILTSNGVYRVRNWRWCDPADDGGLIFYPEVHALSGLACNCFCTTTRACSSGVEPLSKVFIGTESGVYRSFNEGASFEKCERINNNNTAVYFLGTLGDCLVAGTEFGIFYSDDDGDAWYRPDPDPLACINFNRSVTGGVMFSDQYLAQTFIPVEGQTEVSKVSVYVSVEYPDDMTEDEGLEDNYLELSVWTTDGSGLPDAPLTPGSPPPGVTLPERIYARDVLGPGFKTIYAPVTLPDSSSVYALVVEEFPSSGPGGRKVFRLHTSNQADPYGDGRALVGATDGWVEAGNDVDLFFRVYFSPAQEATPTDNAIDLAEAEGRGLVVDDTGALTTDFKLACLFVVDDSRSEGWGDPEDPLGNPTRRDKQRELVDSLWARTKFTDADGTVYMSYGSVYSFGQETTDRTEGYTNNPTTLKLHLGALFNRGTESNLNDTVAVAVSTLGPQAIIDAVSNSEDPEESVDIIVQYMRKRGILRLDALVDWFLEQPESTRSDWPWNDPDDEVKINSIKDYTDVSDYVVARWANQHSPITFVFADGDDDGSQTASNTALAAEATWDSTGVELHCLGMSSGHRHSDMRTMVDSAGGLHITVAAEDDWDDYFSSLLQGGANSLFSATWNKTIEFTSPTWVEHVVTVYEALGGASCSVEYRQTADRVNWTEWREINSGTTIVRALLLGIDFRITMSDGWNLFSQVPVRPYVSELSYTTVSPGRRYFITEGQSVNGMVFEYLLSAVTDTPLGTRINWGVCRGDSSDFADYELIRENRKGALPNRQRSAQFTDETVRALLPTTTTDNQTYQVLGEDSLPTNWATTDIVQVFTGGIEVDPSRGAYSLDNELGLIIFSQTQPSGLVVRATITRPSVFLVVTGEPTSTIDRRVYRLINGRWPTDSQVVILVNDQIVRGGYFLTPEEGTVTFLHERESFDVVTAYVQPSSVFRVGAEMLVYDTFAEPLIENFVLLYTQTTNQGLVKELENPDAPEVVSGTLELTPAGATSKTRLNVSYTYYSPVGAKERDTQISWWRMRPGEDTSGYAEVDADGFVRVAPINGFTGGSDYENRTVEREGDVGAEGLFQDGDRWYVIVTPSDGYALGAPADSRPAITLGGNTPPYVFNIDIASPVKERRDGIDYVPEGNDLTATYQFSDAEGDADMSVIQWYEKDGSTPTHTGRVLPASLVTTGKVYGFTIFPYDGELYGNSASSDYITVL